MRVATLIISLFLTVGLFVQSLLVSAGGELLDDQGTAESGAVGILVAFLFLLGAAFVLGLPRLATGLFAVAALLAFVGSGDFPDLVFWGIVAIALAVMAYFGHREKRRKEAPPPAVAE